MELSNPAILATDAIDRRKSGRAKQKPVLYQQDPTVPITTNGSGKRKRAETVNADVDDVDDVDGSENESTIDESDGDPDEEELKEKRRALKIKNVPIRPAAKKPKKNLGAVTNMPMRPATNGIKKVAKPKKPRAQKITSGFANPYENDLFGEPNDL